MDEANPGTETAGGRESLDRAEATMDQKHNHVKFRINDKPESDVDIF